MFKNCPFCPIFPLWLGVAGLAIWAAIHTTPQSMTGAENAEIRTPAVHVKDLSPAQRDLLNYLASTNPDKTMSENFPVPSQEALKEKLTPLQYDVCINKGTERSFTGEYWDNHKEGIYVCRVCELPLFKSDTKFESGTGWPSFFQPIDPKHVKDVRDVSHGMVREETVCANCGSHLGHVFNDGPKPTGLRFCMNSASLKFIETAEAKPE